MLGLQALGSKQWTQYAFKHRGMLTYYYSVYVSSNAALTYFSKVPFNIKHEVGFASIRKQASVPTVQSTHYQVQSPLCACNHWEVKPMQHFQYLQRMRKAEMHVCILISIVSQCHAYNMHSLHLKL